MGRGKPLVGQGWGEVSWEQSGVGCVMTRGRPSHTWLIVIQIRVKKCLLLLLLKTLKDGQTMYVSLTMLCRIAVTAMLWQVTKELHLSLILNLWKVLTCFTFVLVVRLLV